MMKLDTFSEQWQNPGRVLWEHCSTYVRAHTCRITHAIDRKQNETHRGNCDYRDNSGNIETRTSQLKSKSIKIDSSDEEISKVPHKNSNQEINGINQIINNRLLVDNDIDDMNKNPAEVTDLTKSISRVSIDENSDSGILTYPHILLPSKN